MTIERINYGAAPNDGTGDLNRDAWMKADNNFVDLDTRVSAAIPLAQKGAAGGVAPLNESGVVPAANLPSYVDDVVEVATHDDLPNPGEAGKIYVVLNDTGTGGTGQQNVQYRWSGSGYVELIASPGTTDNVPEGATNKYLTAPRVISALSSDALGGRSNLGVYSKAEVNGLISAGVANAVPWFAANAIPAVNVGSDIEVQGIGLMSWNGSAYASIMQSNTMKNKLINGEVSRINQRGFNGDWSSLSDGTYGYDRWKKSGSNIQQVIEAGSFRPGVVHTLSGTNVTTQQITAPASGNWTITVPNTATGVQVEEGIGKTPFEYRNPGMEMLLCRRYFQTSSGNLAYTQPGNAGTVTQRFPIYLSVPMRSTPTVVVTIGVGAVALVSANNTLLNFGFTGSSMQENNWSFTASAEL